jgi:acyl-CoA reductase-like NAD-dependent aldehyde dehydrogenase
MVRNLRHLIAKHAMVLAKASASARFRPALESLTAEVLPLAEACRFLEREAKALLAPRRLGRRGLPLWLSGVDSEVHREPLGVVLIIGPGNYPLLLPGVQMLQALVAGNAVLLKPGKGGSAVARAFCDLILQAGFDPTLVTLFSESTDDARAAIAARPDKILFTGSTVVGERILQQLAPQFIPATMELSGCDAVIIRADADLDLAVKALVFGLTLNGGATCMAPKRVFVSATLCAQLESRLKRAFESTSAALVTNHKLSALLNGALADGAHIIAGGIRADGNVETPIVLAGVSPRSRLLQADVFAPVLAIVAVADDREAIQCANDCPFALTASIFSGDVSAAHRMALDIKGGVITINDLILPTADPRVP